MEIEEKFIGQIIFEKWLLKNKKIRIKKEGSARQYSDYLVNIWTDKNVQSIDTNSDVNSIDESMKSLIATIKTFYNKINKTGINYLTAAIYFAQKEHECYSYTILDLTRILIELANLKDKNKSIQTYLNRFQMFINAVINKPNIMEKQKWRDEIVQSIEKLKPVCAKKNLHKIDGNESLANELGEKKFIQLAVESCYFLNENMVKNRFDYLSNLFSNSFKDKNGETVRIPTRETTKKDGQTEGSLDKLKKNFIVDGLTIPVIIDSNGNQQVCSLINESTGYYHQTGKDNIFQNYIISHIWGHAYDPRYFTNWWNVVLVPAWANGLLDKENCLEGSLASKFRATIMKICHALYQNIFKDKNNWSSMNIYPEIKNLSDIVAINYTINILETGEHTSNGTSIGKIRHECIHT